MEPEFQPVSNPDALSHTTANSQEGARLNIIMNRLLGGRGKCWFMMCTFSVLSL